MSETDPEYKRILKEKGERQAKQYLKDQRKKQKKSGGISKTSAYFFSCCYFCCYYCEISRTYSYLLLKMATL